MPKIDALVAAMRQNPKNVRYADLCRVCDHFFGASRQQASSHRVYRTPWPGDPRVNIQDDHGKAKAYQVKQVLAALDRLQGGKMLAYDRYTYRVTWSEDDQEHVGLCAEFSSLSWLAATPEAALSGIRQVVADVVADLQGSGEPVPEPLATRRYTGKFMVRVPPEVHRRLVIEAAEEGISLNRIVSARLSR